MLGLKWKYVCKRRPGTQWYTIAYLGLVPNGTAAIYELYISLKCERDPLFSSTFSFQARFRDEINCLIYVTTGNISENELSAIQHVSISRPFCMYICWFWSKYVWRNAQMAHRRLLSYFPCEAIPFVYLNSKSIECSFHTNYINSSWNDIYASFCSEGYYATTRQWYGLIYQLCRTEISIVLRFNWHFELVTSLNILFDSSVIDVNLKWSNLQQNSFILDNA